MNKMKSYSELLFIPDFLDRFQYLKMNGTVGQDTFGYNRYLNQDLYTSGRWKATRKKVILRDMGMDLGVEGFDIAGNIIVHHINPLTREHILNDDPIIYDLDNLICTSELTHKAIHFGDVNLLPKSFNPRTPGDTCPWKRR